EQLTDAAAGRIGAPVVETATSTADPAVDQLSPDAPRRVATGPRPERSPDGAAQATPGQSRRQLVVRAPPPEAVDRCEAVAAGQAEPVEGLDCSAVLEAAAFARRSPEERLLAFDDSLTGMTGSRPDAGQTIPNAALVAQRLATGDPMGSAAAQAIASEAGRAAQPEAPTVISITNPDGTTGTIVVPPGQR